MNKKFVYTAEDAAGCIVHLADFTQCQDCIFDYEDKECKKCGDINRSLYCEKYADKPESILNKGKPCPYKAAKF